ncbi:MAG: DUF3127 domain-containing protein [Bacteroidales bacterium]|nr:DUF3127 domain-containing protein [Bacteroidales bacterium]
MALELECKIVRLLPETRGTSARGAWAKQEFIVEYQDGKFPTQVVFNVWGEEAVADLQKFKVGDQVKASLRPSSREFNGRWYTDIRVWRLEHVWADQQPAAPAYAAPAAPAPAAAPAYGAPAAAPAPSWDSVPAGFAPAAPAPTAFDDFGTPADDDLPF